MLSLARSSYINHPGLTYLDQDSAIPRGKVGPVYVFSSIESVANKAGLARYGLNRARSKGATHDTPSLILRSWSATPLSVAAKKVANGMEGDQ